MNKGRLSMSSGPRPESCWRLARAQAVAMFRLFLPWTSPEPPMQAITAIQARTLKSDPGKAHPMLLSADLAPLMLGFYVPRATCQSSSVCALRTRCVLVHG